MDIVILNTSRLRVAIDKYVKKNNEHSMTDCFKRKNLNSSILSKSENRFVSSYKNKVTAEIDEYITYGLCILMCGNRLKILLVLKQKILKLKGFLLHLTA